MINEKRQIKRDGFLEYEIEGDRINWIEIAFSNYSVAKTWDAIISKWMERKLRLHKISRNGSMWLIVAKGLSFEKFQIIYDSDLTRAPKKHEN
jgi:hypothetical protein